MVSSGYVRPVFITSLVGLLIFSLVYVVCSIAFAFSVERFGSEKFRAHNPPSQLIAVTNRLYGICFPASIFGMVIYWNALYDYHGGNPNLSQWLTHIISPLLICGGETYCRCNSKLIYGCRHLTSLEIANRDTEYPELRSLRRDEMCSFIYEPLNWSSSEVVPTTTIICFIVVFIMAPFFGFLSFVFGGKGKFVPRRTDFSEPDMWMVGYGSSRFEAISPRCYLYIRSFFFMAAIYCLVVSLLRQIVIWQWFVFFSHWTLVLQCLYFLSALFVAKIAIASDNAKEA